MATTRHPRAADRVTRQHLRVEEIFGPVAYAIPFCDEAKVIELVNSSPYGLANSVWSSDLDRANRVAERLVVGE